MTTTDNDEFDALYGSRYLAVSDLKGETPRRKIGKVEVAELKQKDGSTKKKYVLFLEKEDKALVLNTTNAEKLAEAFGKDTPPGPAIASSCIPGDKLSDLAFVSGQCVNRQRRPAGSRHGRRNSLLTILRVASPPRCGPPFALAGQS